jgi:hypothetical protein
MRHDTEQNVPRGTCRLFRSSFPKTDAAPCRRQGKLVFDEVACVRHDLGGLRCGSEYEAVVGP